MYLGHRGHRKAFYLTALKGELHIMSDSQDSVCSKYVAEKTPTIGLELETKARLRTAHTWTRKYPASGLTRAPQETWR